MNFVEFCTFSGLVSSLTKVDDVMMDNDSVGHFLFYCGNSWSHPTLLYTCDFGRLIKYHENITNFVHPQKNNETRPHFQNAWRSHPPTQLIFILISPPSIVSLLRVSFSRHSNHLPNTAEHIGECRHHRR